MERFYHCRNKSIATKVVNALKSAGFNAWIEPADEDDYGYYAAVDCDYEEYWGKVHPLACEVTLKIAFAKIAK